MKRRWLAVFPLVLGSIFAVGLTACTHPAATSAPLAELSPSPTRAPISRLEPIVVPTLPPLELVPIMIPTRPAPAPFLVPTLPPLELVPIVVPTLPALAPFLVPTHPPLELAPIVVPTLPAPAPFLVPTHPPLELAPIVVPTLPAPAPFLVPTLPPLELAPIVVPTLPPLPELEPNLDVKLQMLEWINDERAKAGAPLLRLGSNAAAQIHAENMLAACMWSFWGADGTKDYTRYSLAGGYQYSFPDGFYMSRRPDRCGKSTDGYVTLSEPLFPKIKPGLEDLVHTRTYGGLWLDPYFQTISMGLAWDTYTLRAFLQLEPDFVDFKQLPTIHDGILEVQGHATRGVEFKHPEDLEIGLIYDPPPRHLTEGQLQLAKCYSRGRPAASILPRLAAGVAHPATDTAPWTPCKSPHDLKPNERVEPAPPLEPVTVHQVTASRWDVEGDRFAITADISAVLAEHGPGIYTLEMVTGSDDLPIGLVQYSIFHEVTPPTTYSRPVSESTQP